jgi:hypothetical protein
MRNLIKGRSTLFTVLAAAVLIVVAGGGGAVAGGLVTSAKIKNNTIQSIDVKNNALTGTDIKNSTLGAADVKDFSLTNQDIGVLFASVKGNGTLDSSSGGVTVVVEGSGEYDVRFAGRDIRKCAFTATTGSLIESAAAGQVTVADLASRPDGVYVWTQDSAGNTEAKDFHLVVVC